MAVDPRVASFPDESLAHETNPRAVSVFVVATEEAEVHGALANETGRFVHVRRSRVVSVFYSFYCFSFVAIIALHVQVSRVIRCAFGVWYRDPGNQTIAS